MLTVCTTPLNQYTKRITYTINQVSFLTTYKSNAGRHPHRHLPAASVMWPNHSIPTFMLLCSYFIFIRMNKCYFTPCLRLIDNVVAAVKNWSLEGYMSLKKGWEEKIRPRSRVSSPTLAGLLRTRSKWSWVVTLPRQESQKRRSSTNPRRMFPKPRWSPPHRRQPGAWQDWWRARRASRRDREESLLTTSEWTVFPRRWQVQRGVKLTFGKLKFNYQL